MGEVGKLTTFQCQVPSGFSVPKIIKIGSFLTELFKKKCARFGTQCSTYNMGNIRENTDNGKWAGFKLEYSLWHYLRPTGGIGGESVWLLNLYILSPPLFELTITKQCKIRKLMTVYWKDVVYHHNIVKNLQFRHFCHFQCASMRTFLVVADERNISETYHAMYAMPMHGSC